MGVNRRGRALERGRSRVHPAWGGQCRAMLSACGVRMCRCNGLRQIGLQMDRLVTQGTEAWSEWVRTASAPQVGQGYRMFEIRSASLPIKNHRECGAERGHRSGRTYSTRIGGQVMRG